MDRCKFTFPQFNIANKKTASQLFALQIIKGLLYGFIKIGYERPDREYYNLQAIYL